MDFEAIDSAEAAEALVRDGKLVAMLLFPAEFGGAAIPQNTVYVPAAVAEITAQATQTLIGLVQAGSINQLKVTPSYKGPSRVPSKIAIAAWHDGKDGKLNHTIDIW